MALWRYGEREREEERRRSEGWCDGESVIESEGSTERERAIDVFICICYFTR